MKTLGQLQVGDTFYLINYDESNHISDVREKVVSVITDFTTSKIVKYWDAEGILHGITITKDEFESTNVMSHYLHSICSDDERDTALLREDKASFLNNYSRIMSQLEF